MLAVWNNYQSIFFPITVIESYGKTTLSVQPKTDTGYSKGAIELHCCLNTSVNQVFALHVYTLILNGYTDAVIYFKIYYPCIMIIIVNVA